MKWRGKTLSQNWSNSPLYHFHFSWQQNGAGYLSHENLLVISFICLLLFFLSFFLAKYGCCGGKEDCEK